VVRATFPAGDGATELMLWTSSPVAQDVDVASTPVLDGARWDNGGCNSRTSHADSRRRPEPGSPCSPSRALHSILGLIATESYRGHSEQQAGSAAILGKRGGGKVARAGVPGSSIHWWLVVATVMSVVWGAFGQSAPESSVAGGELITNGDFEQEDLAGWALWAVGDGDGCVDLDVSGSVVPTRVWPCQGMANTARRSRGDSR